MQGQEEVQRGNPGCPLAAGGKCTPSPSRRASSCSGESAVPLAHLGPALGGGPTHRLRHRLGHRSPQLLRCRPGRRSRLAAHSLLLCRSQPGACSGGRLALLCRRQGRPLAWQAGGGGLDSAGPFGLQRRPSLQPGGSSGGQGEHVHSPAAVQLSSQGDRGAAAPCCCCRPHLRRRGRLQPRQLSRRGLRLHKGRAAALGHGAPGGRGRRQRRGARALQHTALLLLSDGSGVLQRMGGTKALFGAGRKGWDARTERG